MFSIIIPTYNRAHVLPRTITSVLAQTYSNWECIIVDDGSTDNTKELIASYTDPRITYIYQTNAERSAARNNGIRQAQGEYICFLDSDDLFEPNHLSCLYNEIKAKNFPIAMFFVHAFDYADGQKSEPEIISLNGNPIHYFFTQPIIPARVCIHNQILKELTFDEDIVIVEDLVLWVKIANRFPTFEVKEHTVLYRLHEDNSINLKNNSYEKRYNGLKTFFRRYPDICTKIPGSLRNEIMSNTLFGIAKHFIYVHNRRKAMYHLWCSLLKKPSHAMTLHKILLMAALIKLYPNRILKQYQ